MLANVELKGTYSTHYDYIHTERSWNEFKELFNEDDIKEIVNSKESDDDKISALCEHLNSLGWSDEEIINKFLMRDKEYWFLIYRDENTGYFDLYEVMI